MSYTWKTIRKIIMSINKDMIKYKDITKEIDFSKKYRSIKLQFLIFLQAFVSKIVISFILIEGSCFKWYPFALAILQILSHVTIYIIPVLCMLFIHHNTFKVQDEMSELISEI